jgi:hypothetical protein
MNIYDPIADALNLSPIEYRYPGNLIEGVDYFPWKHSPPPNKGKPMSEEQKQLISAAMIGRKKDYPTWNKGIPCSEEQKLIQSQKMKGRARSPEACAAISKGKLGKKRKPFSEETKRKISEAAKKQWENSRINGTPIGRKRAINSLIQ